MKLVIVKDSNGHITDIIPSEDLRVITLVPDRRGRVTFDGVNYDIDTNFNESQVRFGLIWRDSCNNIFRIADLT